MALNSDEMLSLLSEIPDGEVWSIGVSRSDFGVIGGTGCGDACSSVGYFSSYINSQGDFNFLSSDGVVQGSLDRTLFHEGQHAIRGTVDPPDTIGMSEPGDTVNATNLYAREMRSKGFAGQQYKNRIRYKTHGH